MDSNMRGMLKKGRGGLPKIRKIRKDFDGKTQAVRGSLIAELEELQQWAAKRAKAVRNEKLKQKWVHAAAYLAQTITYIAGAFDTSEVDARLDKLERMFHELKRKKKNGSPGKGN